MLRTLSTGAESTLGARRPASISRLMRISRRACPGPRAMGQMCMAGTRPAITSGSFQLPPKPFRFARQFDRLHFFELDGAFGHEVIEIAIGRPGNLRAI